jgi:bifunctional non-homologous end joining protein LigD
MRQPIYLGLRDDIDPRSVHRERAVPIALALAPRRYAARNERVEEVEIEGHMLQLKKLDKVYWPEQRLTKRDLSNYYRGIAPLILPYLVDRPQSLHRFPNGINRESFFQKNVAGPVPEWVRTIKIGDGPDAETYLLCQDEASTPRRNPAGGSAARALPFQVHLKGFAIVQLKYSITASTAANLMTWVGGDFTGCG